MNLQSLSNRRTLLFGLLVLAIIALVVVFLQVRGKAYKSGAYGYVYPSASLFARLAGSGNSFNTGPIRVAPGKKIELQWNSNNVDSCTSNWAKGTVGTTGAAIVGPYNAKNAPLLVISCTGPYGATKDTLQVIVGNFGY